jgi:uncharacterized phiE125 gp8 family phage protein
MIYAQKPVLVTPPSETPVSLAEAKAHLRVDHSAEDSTIGIYLNAAVSSLDGFSGVLGRAMVTQVWRQDSVRFPSGVMRLPLPDVSAVTVAYTDQTGSEQTLSASKYHVLNDAIGSLLVLAENEVWPNTDEIPSAVRVTLTCGYGGASDVPWELKAAILLDVGASYQDRELSMDRAIQNPAYNAAVSKYRKVGIS